MNILRTIQKDEKEDWVNLLFYQGPHKGDNVPGYPPGFPLPFKLKHYVEGSFIYLVYKSKIIGYGKIAKVVRHNDVEVGTERQVVYAGDMIVLNEPLNRMPFTLSCRGFQGVRYTAQNLHELDQDSAEAELRVLKLAAN